MRRRRVKEFNLTQAESVVLNECTHLLHGYMRHSEDRERQMLTVLASPQRSALTRDIDKFANPAELSAGTSACP